MEGFTGTSQLIEHHLPTEMHGENGVSKRLVNKILETMRPYGFSREVIAQAIEQAGVAGFSPEESGVVNTAMPSVFEAAFSKDHGFDEISFQQPSDFIRLIAKKVLEHQTFDDVVLTIGMGGYSAMPSIRLPAYVSSAIHSLNAFEKLAHSGIIMGSPRLRVFRANHFAAHVNGFDCTKVLEVSEKTFSFLSDFLDRFFPELKGKVLLESDSDWLDNGNASEMQNLRDVAQLLKASGETRTEIDTLLRMGQKHGGGQGAENAFLYAAAHPFYNETIMAEKSSMFESFSRKDRPSLIIDHGGRPQGTFNKVVNAIRGNVALQSYRQPVVVDTIVPTGKVPVYYRARDYDLGIDEDPSTFDLGKIDRLTKNDFKAIDRLVGLENYFRFLKEKFDRR